ncbi:MAG TPA: DegT/DnrJ/EryC1/StrS aminotransferase family protein [Dehalococcoidia bacterium]|nr:DegT/DnrJ/EryC1/StrS aminotransferase family protein [Dehalococcoidia bacterium]
MSEPFLPYNLPDIGEDEIGAVVETLRSGWLAPGPRVQAFEEAFAERIGVRHAIAVTSCTAGMHLALLACGVGPGDEVIVPVITFPATANVVVHAGATPVLADVGPDDLNLDPDAVRERLTGRTKAIMPVHYAGQACPMQELRAIAGERGLRLIEDAAHAFGTMYRGEPVGRTRDAAVFSFYVTKNITTGAGGMVTTDDDAVAEEVRRRRMHGLSANAWDRYTASGTPFYQVVAPGYNYTMSDLEAALGLAQLRRADAFLVRRRELAGRYAELLSDVPEIALPEEREAGHSWHLYVIRLRRGALDIDRDAFLREMREEGIGVSVHFIPLHYHPYYREAFGWKRGDYPNAEAAFEEIVSLPLYTRMTDGDVERVAKAVRRIVERHRR